MSLETQIIQEAVRAGASDIHIDPRLEGYTIRMRIDGVLQTWRKTDRAAGEKLVNQIKADAGIEVGSVYHPVDERHRMEVEGRSVDLRITLAPCVAGPKLSIRLLDPARVKKDLPSLGLSGEQADQLQRWLNDLNGMVLVTGPTASGKTTTLYGLLHELLEDSRHVVTIEDPVEYEIDGINQMEVDEKHGLDFAEGVKTSLRLDPDCLMIGEIREERVAAQAVAASIQGHVVLATLHSRDAVSGVTRLRNFGLADHQIATAVGVIVNQRLARLLCPECRTTRPPTEVERAFLDTIGEGDVPEVGEASGCESCHGSGFRGRAGVFEVWNLNRADYEMILDGADEDAIRQRWRSEKVPGLSDHAHKLIESGTVSVREIMHLGLALPWENQ